MRIRINIIVILFLVTPIKSFAQITSPHFFSPEHKLSFSYDAAFFPQKDLSSTQLISLKVADIQYPEFEIQKIEGNKDIASLSAQDYADRETMELARIGIVDVKVLETKRYQIAQRDLWVTELRFPYADKVLLAAIIVVPGEGDFSYRLIYRDIVASYFRHKPLRNQIFDSFQLGEKPLPAPTPVEQMMPAVTAPVFRSSIEPLLISGVAVFLILLLLWQVRRKAFK
jgi:hypothetical protein